MDDFRRVKGIGLVDVSGKVIRKCRCKAQKGFIVVEHNGKKIIYSSESQEKIYTAEINATIEIYEKVVVVFEDAYGVFNLAGECIGWFDKVVVEYDFIKVAKRSVDGDETGVFTVYKWGLYTSEGKKLFTEDYFSIGYADIHISDVEEILFYPTDYETGKSALFDSKKRLLIPWGMYSITVNTYDNIVITNIGEKNEIEYHIQLDNKKQVKVVPKMKKKKKKDD